MLTAVGLPILLYGLISTWRLDWPGPYYDEMLFVNAALGGQDDTSVTTRIAGVPVMLMPYIGALKAWIYAPIFRCFGVSVWSLRLPAVGLGAASIALTYLYVSRLFTPQAGRLAAWLTAVEPSFIFHTRWDWGPSAVMMVCKALLLVGVAEWWRSGRVRGCWVALIAAVLGTFDKANFVWIVVGVGVATLLTAPRSLMPLLRRRFASISAGLLLVAVAGAAWSLSRGGFPPSRELVTSGLTARAAVVGGLLTQTMGGVGPYGFIIGDAGRLGRLQTGSLAAAGMMALIAWLLCAQRRRMLRPLLFVIAASAVLLAQIVLTRRATGPHHTALLSPLWLVALAGMAATPFTPTGDDENRMARLRVARILSLAAVGLVMLGSIAVNVAYLNRVDGPVANVRWDPGINRLVAFARNHPDRQYVSVDWGIHTVLHGLTQGRVRCLDRWPTFMKPVAPADVNHLATLISAQDTLFVVTAPGAETFPVTREHFVAMCRERDWPLETVAEFTGAQDRPLLQVFRIDLRGGLTTTAAPEPTVVSSTSPLKIHRIHPASVRIGERFHPQPDGNSALAVECDGATPATVVVFNGTPLPTVFGGSRLVTATVTADLVAQPGNYPIVLRDGVSESAAIELTVRP